jgi:L-asparaginase / beta-aspartyl-peptidase
VSGKRSGRAGSAAARRRLTVPGMAVLWLGIVAGCAEPQTQGDASPAGLTRGAEFGLVIHGGAGTITRDQLTPALEEEYRSALQASLEEGYRILENGGSAMDAVVAAVRIMEDDSLFNAGRGAVFTSEGTNELDAAVMDGRDRDAGAVAGVTRVRNPIDLARLVMEESPHVFMTGEGAEIFGRQHGIEEVDPSWFHTEHRWEALERAREAETFDLGWWREEGRILGTVGAVARDRDGNLAAATSTGGMTNKRFGRVGDVPVIGAGTYASNESCAVSATGHGEYFIRNVVAREICARMEHRGESLQEAADAVVMEQLRDHGGTGGIVAVDREGNISMTLNTPGMYRGHYLAGADPFTAIYADEGSGL